MVVIDATMLLLFLRPDIPGPKDAQGRPLPYARQRIQHLVAQLDDKPGEIIAIPAPVLSEVLIRRSPLETRQIIALPNKRGVFSIEPFDQRAAIELAQMLKKRPGKGPETWAKLKFDCQIVAIAKVGGATTFTNWEPPQAYRSCARATSNCHPTPIRLNSFHPTKTAHTTRTASEIGNRGRCIDDAAAERSVSRYPRSRTPAGRGLYRHMPLPAGTDNRGRHTGRGHRQLV